MRAVCRDQDIQLYYIQYSYTLVTFLPNSHGLASTSIACQTSGFGSILIWAEKMGQIIKVSQHLRVTEAIQLGVRDSSQGQETPIHKVEAVSWLLVVKAPRSWQALQLGTQPNWCCQDTSRPALEGFVFNLQNHWRLKCAVIKAPNFHMSSPTTKLCFTSRRFLLISP